MQLEDAHILKLFQTDEQKAFSSLVMKYQERVYWHVRKMVVNHEDANDITQNIFIKVWKALSKFKKESNLYTWIYRIATNETLNFIKANKNKIAQSLENIQIENKKDDSYFSGDEIEAKLHQALATLPEKQKLVFNMKYYQEMKYEEISEILNTSVGGLKASYHLAVKKVESYLKAD